MKRRALLRATGAALGGGTAAVAGLRLAGDASAETAMTLDVVGDSATVGAGESVTAVTLALHVSWSYALPATMDPETVIVEIAAGPADGALSVVDAAESATLFTEADGEESFDAGLLGALDAAALAPDSGSRDTSVTIDARLRVEDSSGAVLARESVSDQATVTVERASAPASEYGELGGSGSLTIETGSE